MSMANQRHLDATKAQRKSVTRILAKVRTIGRELRGADSNEPALVDLAAAADSLREAENWLLSAETHLQDGQTTGRPAA